MSSDKLDTIQKSVREVLGELPSGVTLVAASKTRTPEQVLAAVEAGITHIGHNYVQEAEAMYDALQGRVKWHFIGHLQKNKAKKAVRIFDMIETVDSVPLAEKIDRECEKHGKTMSVLIEVNSGREQAKSGVLPEQVDDLAREISRLEHICVEGLMTMGPFTGDPEDARPYFTETRKAFDRLAGADIPGLRMNSLSMGMSNSYKVAIQEGANIIRIGTRLFGTRVYL